MIKKKHQLTIGTTLAVISFLILLLNPLLNRVYYAFSDILLKIAFNTNNSPISAPLLSGKLQTLSVLISFLILLLFFKNKIYKSVKLILTTKELRSFFFYASLLTIPGIFFYFTAIKLLYVSETPIIIFGALSTYFLELTIISSIFLVTSPLGHYRSAVTITVIASYEIIVSAMTILVYVSGEIDYIKYLDMAWGADYQWIVHWNVIFPSLLFTLAVVLISNKTNKIIENYNINYWELGGAISVILLIAYSAKPIIVFGNALALPERSLRTHMINIDSYSTNLASVGHFPNLLKSMFQTNEYSYQDHVPDTLKPTTERHNLFSRNHEDKKSEPLFKTIILLTVESFSLNFTGYNNAQPCNQTITPNIDALMSKYPSGAIWTNTSPTLYGLSTIFSSHPNAKLVLKQEYPNSFVKILSDNGYRTAFIRSAPEKYSNEHILFKKAGFTEIYGQDYFSNEIGMNPHISGWGLEDAYLFSHTIDFLKQHKINNKSGKIFLHLLPADTHTPYGREHYSNKYPELPSDLTCDIDNKKLLMSFHRQDHDIGIFYNNLVKNGLLDSETLFIITADHSAPRFYNPAPAVLDKIPLVFISKRNISDLHLNQANMSQVDIAPTILELAGLQIPWGYFGKSLLEVSDRSYIGIHNNVISLRGKDGERKVYFDNPKLDEDNSLLEILNTVFTQSSK